MMKLLKLHILKGVEISLGIQYMIACSLKAV